MSKAVKITLVVVAVLAVIIIGLWAFNTPTGSSGHVEGPASPTALILSY